MRSLYRSAIVALLVVGSPWAFSQGANAAVVSIASQVFTGNAPVLGTPTPASASGSFIQSTTGDIPSTVLPADWLMPGGPPRVQLSPYAFNTDGNNNASYSVLDSGSGPVSNAIYNVGSDSFTLLWGSPDSYNQVAFFSGLNGSGTSEGMFGSPNLACGSTICQDIGFDLVTFVANGGSIGSVQLADTGPAAFEYGVGATPLPGSIWLFGSVLGGAFWLARRKRSAVSGLGAA